MPKRQIPKDVRSIVNDRDGGVCQWKGCGLSRSNGDVMNLHHVLPEQFGGSEAPDNLITLCNIHHKQMHIEFSAYYPDSEAILNKMNSITRSAVSKFRKMLFVDDGYDLSPHLFYLTRRLEFRPGQLKTIRAAIAGKGVLFVTPTGSGKSVTYQLPGLLGQHPSLVISPLKALMKDQVESIWSKKIPTTYINGDLSDAEIRKRYNFIHKSLYKFIFVAPERFKSRDPRTNGLYRQYSHLVVDEAHSIDTWGVAFRPSYRELGALRSKLANPPVIALTATASKVTQQRILDSLNIPDAEVIVTGFKKENISIEIEKFDYAGATLLKHERVYEIITGSDDDKILIFTPTIERGKELLEFLRAKSVEVDLYHSKLDTKMKMEIQNRFTGVASPGLRILISTSAFGMGIDIPDIRKVIHLSPALSITDYVQQIGRAGRDGAQSYAHLLYDPSDDGLIKYMSEISLHSKDFKERNNYTDDDVVRVRNQLSEQIGAMLEILEQEPGREWDYILDYFGESAPNYWDRNGLFVSNVVGATLLIVIMTLIFSVF